ncbi:MAG: DUF2059 domain-containing protein, partial [Pseudomonadota bacterium]
MKTTWAPTFAAVTLMTVFIQLWQTLPCAQTRDPALEKIMKISGLRGQVQSMPASFLITIPSDMFSDNRERTRFYSRIKDEVTAESLLEIFQETFTENIDQENLNQVLQFYESGLGRKVGRLQSEALSSNVIQTIREGRRFAASLDENRLTLLERLIDLLGTDRNNIMLRRLIVRLLGATDWNRRSVNDSNLDARLQFMESSFENDSSSLRELTLNCFANTFKSLSNSELDALTRFYES